MKHKPASLAEALDFRHEFPGYPITFSETTEAGDCIDLSGLPEIDLCFEDHGLFIFGLNTSLKSISEYLENRTSPLTDQLKHCLLHNKPDALLGELVSPSSLTAETKDCLALCHARLKTYNGTHGREISFSAWPDEARNPVLQAGELPLLIIIPK